ncbi:ABC transporter permease [Paenibacillus sacheonensis]|uniref:ABC transporter permease subunit n=1 Tax=Paenibacillus sacheonensis TaxID=742054 RepID=A0A7X4YKH4_9BACL|nr:ABC transporter permease subunit [Paenibacillus sacheonensis]MBM7563679.1 putative aldouronate transport system permease protein [Paenibacillus sacheonensis]NBC67963.1 ABC transporter permease subunit [Paenibacillus sacheonensis]
MFKRYGNRRELPLHLMLVPGLVMLLIFAYVPMMGIIIAFQQFNPVKGLFGDQNWVGLANFKTIFAMPNIWQVIGNTVFIAVMKIILGMIVPIVFALLLNEVKQVLFKRVTQTIIYFPYFLSWIILSGIMIDILSPSTGLANVILSWFGLGPVYFLGENSWFPYTMVASDVWKNFGFNSVIYLATITSIDTTLYEASAVDGAGRWRQTWHVTLPGMRMIIVLLMVLSLGSIFDAGFDQIFNLYSPQVFASGDIIDTMIYRLGLQQSQYSISAGVGLMKSGVSFVLITVSYYMAYRLFKYRFF